MTPPSEAATVNIRAIELAVMSALREVGRRPGRGCVWRDQKTNSIACAISGLSDDALNRVHEAIAAAMTGRCQ